jgi:proline iminopeptidase
VLRGIFLTGRADLDWFFRDSAQFLPEAWARFTAIAPRRHLLYYCASVLAGEPNEAARKVVRAWLGYEEAAMAYATTAAAAPPPPEADAAEWARLIDKYRIQSHYLAQRCFLGEIRLLELARRCGELPTAILQGRRDLICRPQNAWQLHQAMAQSRLQFVETAGHNPFEPAMAAALVAATGHFARHGQFLDWP